MGYMSSPDNRDPLKDLSIPENSTGLLFAAQNTTSHTAMILLSYPFSFVMICFRNLFLVSLALPSLHTQHVPSTLF